MTRKRHVCNACKKKRDEKFMVETSWKTRYGKRIWRCDGDWCKKRTRLY
ncbi:hypothetical protein J4226_00200 [Candidatus Pacearchaeota archaeon]|nr:hypothetical protein [Candidatus Pacearchaeota archaeon]